jgi:molybdopterin molybdotransferase
VAASVGAAQLDVIPRARAAVLTTGDEVVPYDHTPVSSQIRNCNGIMLLALLRRLGCDAFDLGMVRDDPDVIRAAIARALESHDVLFVTGGMSMGDYDFVPRVLRELGAALKITKLRIKPGKPFVFATLAGDKYVFGLPGNPVSGFACTLRLGSRLLARLAGKPPREAWIEAILDGPLPPNGPREFYQPAQLLRSGPATPRVRALEWKSSGDVFTLARADCLVVRPENDPTRPAGSVVGVLEIPR